MIQNSGVSDFGVSGTRIELISDVRDEEEAEADTTIINTDEERPAIFASNTKTQYQKIKVCVGGWKAEASSKERT